MQIYPLSTQTGEFSYRIEIIPRSTGDFSFGFLDNSESESFSFNGEKGKLIDQDQRFFFSYSKDLALLISGNSFEGYHNYFVNGVPFSFNCSKNSEPIENFFFDSNADFDFNLFLDLELPDYEISNAIFEGGIRTGEILIENNNPSVSFNFFSGEITNSNFSFESFPTGRINDTGVIEVLYDDSVMPTGAIPIQGRFFTSFGEIPFSLFSENRLNLEFNFNVSPPSEIGFTGRAPFTFSYSHLRGGSVDNEAESDLTIDFVRISGSGSSNIEADYDFLIGENINSLQSFQGLGYFDAGINGYSNSGAPYLIQGSNSILMAVQKKSILTSEDLFELTISGSGINESFGILFI